MGNLKNLLFISLTCVSTVAVIATIATFIPFISMQTSYKEESDASVLTLFTIDACLVVLFIIQHSGQSSHRYKTWLEDSVLSPVTRSLYVLFTSLALQLLMALWQPISSYSFWMIDTREATLLGFFFTVLHCVLWVILLIEVKIMEPLMLIGVKQVYHYMKGWHPPEFLLPARLQRLMQHLPHPGASCFVLILWLHPHMSLDRGILATVLTAYLCTSMEVTEGDYTYIQQYSKEKKYSYTVETVGY